MIPYNDFLMITTGHVNGKKSLERGSWGSFALNAMDMPSGKRQTAGDETRAISFVQTSYKEIEGSENELKERDEERARRRHNSHP